MRSRGARVGNLGLAGFGLVLGLLMAYTLVIDDPSGPRPDPAPPGAAIVPVFFRDRAEWRIFARGVAACVDERRKLGRIVSDQDDAIRVETVRHRRPITFIWKRVRGEGQAREELRGVLRSGTRPVAVIGSSNTVLTVALAETLRDEAGADPDRAPMLLVPWATSVSLLETYPGRTFRYCSNNRREADLLLACLATRSAEGAGAGPARVEFVIDPLDPYSIDLAACFRLAIAREFPAARIVAAGEGVPGAVGPSLSGRADMPTSGEQSRARAIWRDAVGTFDRPGAAGDGLGVAGETWVILPLQNEPARRMLVALNGAAPGRGEGDREAKPLVVLCGDSVGATTLASFANQLVFPVWGVSTASELGADAGLEDDVIDQAEVVASVLRGLDLPGTTAPNPEFLRRALIDPGSLDRPFGRPIDFTPGGEREGCAPGEVLRLGPESPEVFAYPGGRWGTGRPVDPGGTS